MSWITIVLLAAIAFAWMVPRLYCWSQHGRRPEQDWAGFRHSHRELDAELDEIWHRRERGR